ncbi:MAG: DUF262 domain-containing protein [Desulfovibrio sp.]|nr:DUF262 domain-containing protein [Desulfovibrio sp.]
MDDSTACIFKKFSWDVSGLIADIKQGQIGLPDIQRPFVWTDAQVRDLFDSMFQGYPVGMLLFWEASTAAKVIGTTQKQMSPAHLIIDGQQRLTSLYAVITGEQVLDKNKRPRSIEIAFQPHTGKFEVRGAIQDRDPTWIPSISQIFKKQANSWLLIEGFLNTQREVQGKLDEEKIGSISNNMMRLLHLLHYDFSVLEINSATDEEVVAKIFVRVNSQGQKLKQSDFIFTLMSVYWNEGREAIEKFCEDARTPSKHGNSPYNYFISPEPDDLLRVSICLAFRRGRLKYAYQILTGKDLKTKKVSPEMKDEQFAKLERAQAVVLDLHHWKNFLACVHAAGFRSRDMISSKASLIYTYVFYLIGRQDYGLSHDDLQAHMARWFFMVSLSGRYTSNAEGQIEADMADLEELKTGKDFLSYMDKAIRDTLTDDFWDITLINNLASSTASSPAQFAYWAALVLLDAWALFSTNKLGEQFDAVMNGKHNALEKHHLFPKAYLQKLGITGVRKTNQLANLAMIPWAKNLKISSKPPSMYFPLLVKAFPQQDKLEEHLRQHALPKGWEQMEYDEFLQKRRGMMAKIIKEGFDLLNQGVKI